ncbi:hypothetical protein FG167_05600 [Lacinutrix sp. WUR7]|uniref:hypothetical protein n=1 Tax=Lacinutrix sp. WUR7 TaxID=2653681 RepID=UPI00193DB47D|nr:hypothetical protein [Lacinutrix sp. WUR7]QRM88728.1 hypothetical protein FG167_05600 [Lacinutrix sp. WUR7]
MIKLNKLYLGVFLLIVAFCFLIGGFTQFFIGIPNTVFSYGVMGLFFLFYFVYVIVKQRVIFDKIVLLFFVLFLLIILSSIVNQTNILKTIIYFIFILIPLGSYLFFKINQKERYISSRTISKIYLFIACLQLPAILIQNFGYDFLIRFNNSSQAIASFDFMFGTFFLKADHALGFFLLLNIFNIFENNINNSITKRPKLIVFYLSLTILIAESNITKLLLILFFGYLIYKSFPKKIKVFGILVVLLLMPLAFSQAKKIKAFEREIYFFHQEYNSKKSFSNYKRGIAKRPQVVITYATVLPLRIVGEGPYSYFDVLKGKFAATKHFSQLIWVYADLGIIGLILLILLLYLLVNSFNLDKGVKIILFGVVLIYAFMTTIFSDLAIMITLTSLLQNNKKIRQE